MIALILTLAWNSNGITFNDLAGEDINFAPLFELFIAVAVVGASYAVFTILLFWPLKQDMPPVLVSGI